MPPADRALPSITPAPIIPPEAHALPWVRVVTGLAALAIFAMPAGHHVAEWAARPIPDRVIAVAPLPPLEPLVPQASKPDNVALDSVLAQAGPAQPTARSRSTLLKPPSKELRTAARPRRSVRLAGTRRSAPASTRVAHARLPLTRAQVVREYIASREQVAALTREDSGSAYLRRVAARRQDRSFTR